MRCPGCGTDVLDGDRFCPRCGAGLGDGSRKGPRGRSGMAAAVMIVAVVAIAAVAILAFQDDGPGTYDRPSVVPGIDVDVEQGTSGDGSGTDSESPSEDTFWEFAVRDDVTVSGEGFESGMLAADAGDGDTVVVSLSDEAAEGYSLFNWSLHLENRLVNSVSKREAHATMHLDTLKAGEYTIRVDCYTNLGARSGAPVSYSGSVTIIGDVTDEYSWTYDGALYSMEISYTYQDYRRYADSDTVRSAVDTGDFSTITGLAKVDSTISALESSLKARYLERYGSDADVTGQEYADFILAFVQECFDYDTDDEIYGTEEYWAYPVETLYHGVGDCEDTALLCAAIYSAAGYSTGVFLIPGHAVAAVGLAQYEKPTLTPHQAINERLFYYTYMDVTYYGCETTEDVFQPVGYIGRSYSIDSDGTVYYNNKASESVYGLYAVEAA